MSHSEILLTVFNSSHNFVLHSIYIGHWRHLKVLRKYYFFVIFPTKTFNFIQPYWLLSSNKLPFRSCTVIFVPGTIHSVNAGPSMQLNQLHWAIPLPEEEEEWIGARFWRATLLWFSGDNDQAHPSCFVCRRILALPVKSSQTEGAEKTLVWDPRTESGQCWDKETNIYIWETLKHMVMVTTGLDPRLQVQWHKASYLHFTSVLLVAPLK